MLNKNNKKMLSGSLLWIHACAGCIIFKNKSNVSFRKRILIQMGFKLCCCIIYIYAEAGES